MSLLIKYNGKTIATLEKGQTSTLVCDGKKMLSDVVVEMGGGGSPENLISFTAHDLFGNFSDEVYYAEEGMAWTEWVESDYNTTNWEVYYGRLYVSAFSVYNDSDMSELALPTEVIVANATYYYHASTHGGGSN